MARPLRIDFACRLHHVTARGSAREAFYRDDEAREMFLGLLEKACKRYKAIRVEKQVFAGIGPVYCPEPGARRHGENGTAMAMEQLPGHNGFH